MKLCATSPGSTICTRKPSSTMATHPSEPSATDVSKDDTGAIAAEKTEEIRIENTANELNAIDLELLAAESIQFRSKATLRLAVVILVQAISKNFDRTLRLQSVTNSVQCRSFSLWYRLWHVRHRGSGSISRLFQCRREWIEVGDCSCRDLHR